MIRAAAFACFAFALAACSDEPAADQAEGVGPPVRGEFPEEQPDAAGGLTGRPVMIGSDGPEMDACGTVSKVVLVGGEGEDEAIVRAGPDGSAREVARIAPGHMVAQCDYSDESIWLGIVWDPANPENPNCGTGSPVAEVQEYDGPCRSGWIRSDNLEMIAG